MPILETRSLHWPDEAACAATATELAGRIGLTDSSASVFIELVGTLGAGKTTFARHLLQALGVKGRIKSPTYAVMESYDVERGGAPLANKVAISLSISHFDFYRFDDPQEFEDAGFRDVFSSPGLKLAEWPQNAAGLLPTADVSIHIEAADADAHHAPNARHVRLDAHTALGQRLIE